MLTSETPANITDTNKALKGNKNQPGQLCPRLAWNTGFFMVFNNISLFESETFSEVSIAKYKDSYV